MSVSRPCNTSPLKYDANGPIPILSFCRAIYLRRSPPMNTSSGEYNKPGKRTCMLKRHQATTQINESIPLQKQDVSHQDGDVSEQALCWFIQNIRDFVFKILCRNCINGFSLQLKGNSPLTKRTYQVDSEVISIFSLCMLQFLHKLLQRQSSGQKSSIGDRWTFCQASFQHPKGRIHWASRVASVSRLQRGVRKQACLLATTLQRH